MNLCGWAKRMLTKTKRNDQNTSIVEMAEEALPQDVATIEQILESMVRQND
jgi:hypothetical protein